MLDWSVVIVPLAILAVVLLLPFAGCDLEDHGESSAKPAMKKVTAKLSWQGPATEIRQISFKVTVEELSADDKPIGTPFSAPGVSPAAFPPEYLPSAKETSFEVTVEPAPKFRVTAFVVVTHGAWDSTAATAFPPQLSKTFLKDEEWTFHLSTQTWELS